MSLTGCGSDKGPGIVTEFHPFSDADQKVRDAARNARYRINVGDRIQVDFKYMHELDQGQILILPDGHCTMAGCDAVMAKGLTVAELDSTLTAHFSKDYRNPELSVIIESIGVRKVYIFGQVERPGAYEFENHRISISQALTLAGGFQKGASAREVLLVRVTDTGYLYRVFDLAHMEKKDPLGVAQLEIAANDVIFVPRSKLGDLRYFSSTVLASLLQVGQMFWDIYALSNLDKVNSILR